ncbi:MAG: hypothetical protein M1814_000249 [Vezdaea aestivalis]|nr:MAG: hypothetical protein M1814_000249 [Vezdaea aestivalis]
MSLLGQKRLRADCDAFERPQDEIKKPKSLAITPTKPNSTPRLASGYRTPNQTTLIGSTTYGSITYNDHASSFPSPGPSTPRSQMSDSGPSETANSLNGLNKHQGLERNVDGLDEVGMQLESNDSMIKRTHGPEFDHMDEFFNQFSAEPGSADYSRESQDRMRDFPKEDCPSSIREGAYSPFHVGQVETRFNARSYSENSVGDMAYMDNDDSPSNAAPAGAQQSLQNVSCAAPQSSITLLPILTLASVARKLEMQRSKPIEQMLQRSATIHRSASRQRYVCASCRLQRSKTTSVATFSTQGNQTERKLPWTEKVRRRIWGTDNPPGLKDPYDRDSGPNTPEELDKTLPVKRARPSPTQTLSTEKTPKWDDYTPAATWHGLTQIGETAAEADLSREFDVPVSSNEIKDTEEIQAAFVLVLEELLPSVINFGLTSFPSPDISAPTRSEEQATALRGKYWSVQRNNGKWVLFNSKNNAQIPIDTLLSNKKLKLELLKGIIEQTGNHVSDAQLTSAKSVEDLFQVVIVQPKPPKLAERLMMNPELQVLKNVEIFDRRLTSIDKDVVVGRWKVIEKELKAQGIPPRGSVFRSVD